MDKFDLVRFTDNDFELDVRADSEKETVWLTQDEMALLFDVDRTRILRHINNIYSENELDQKSTCAENAQVRREGKREVMRSIKLYNLDMIVSVGYRVKSHRGILFRRWLRRKGIIVSILFLLSIKLGIICTIFEHLKLF